MASFVRAEAQLRIMYREVSRSTSVHPPTLQRVVRTCLRRVPIVNMIETIRARDDSSRPLTSPAGVTAMNTLRGKNTPERRWQASDLLEQSASAKVCAVKPVYQLVFQFVFSSNGLHPHKRPSTTDIPLARNGYLAALNTRGQPCASGKVVCVKFSKMGSGSSWEKGKAYSQTGCSDLASAPELCLIKIRIDCDP